MAIDDESPTGEPGQDDGPHVRPAWSEIRGQQARDALEALAEKLGISLVRDSAPPAEIPQANFEALDLLDGAATGEGEHGDGEENGC